MTTLGDKASHSFISSFVVIKMTKDLVARAIPKYNGLGNLFLYIN